jgi:hypothetical protein
MAHRRHARGPRATRAPQRNLRTASDRSGRETAVEHTDRWRRDTRSRALRHLVQRTNGLRWSAPLFDALIDELLVGEEEFVSLLGPPKRVATTRYPQAIAVALALRHSWNDLDLRAFIGRLRLPRR